jgi:hypothetical protein
MTTPMFSREWSRKQGDTMKDRRTDMMKLIFANTRKKHTDTQNKRREEERSREKRREEFIWQQAELSALLPGLVAVLVNITYTVANNPGTHYGSKMCSYG